VISILGYVRSAIFTEYRPILLSFSGKQLCIYKLCPLINRPGLIILTNTLFATA
jgi:hypothetical protein